MGTIDLGKISFTQRGNYDNSTSYAPKDVVQHTDQNETSSFVKISSTATGQVPQTNGTINSSHWQIFAKGTSLATPNQGTYDASTTYSKGAVVQHSDSGVISTFLYINNTPASGQTPSTGGTVNSSHWQLIAKGTAAVAVSWQSSPKTANFTAQANEGYFIDTSGGSFTLTTPASPSVGDEFILVDYQGNFGTNNLQIDGNGTDKISGTTDTYFLTNANTSARFVYSGATEGWITVSGSTENDTGVIGLPYNVEYLVVAAGGGGGGDNGGGGGAGGFRTNGSKNFSVIAGSSYTITVGSGGFGGSNSPNSSPTPNSGVPQGESGGNSVFATITSAGGGGGGSSSANGNAGGSGGGGGQNANGGAGNTPSVSPSQGNNGGNSTAGNGGGAGGGGSGGAGANTSGGGSNGGAGTANSITGSSVTYAGGGGGGEDQNTSGNNGSGQGGGGNGLGGGGAGPAPSGTANTGGGGGGGAQNGSATGGRGGSGVVIIRRATSSSSTTSGAVSTSGSDTIHTFNSSGTYIA